MIAATATSLWQNAKAYWNACTRPQKLLFWSGSILFAVMIGYSLALVATGATVSGPVSLRKVITFAESLGLFAWSIGWMLPMFRFSRRSEWIIAVLTTIFTVGETALFALQVARGVPSHYNFSTALDGAVFSATGVGAAVAAGLIIVLLALSGRLRDQSPSMRWSIRFGMALTLLGMGVGILMILNSGGIWQGFDHMLAQMQVNPIGRYAGPPEDAVGGNLVALHAIGLHGIQVVPLAAWLLGFTALPEARRLRLTLMVALGNTLLLAVLLVHALRQLPLSALDPAIALLAAGSVLLALASFAQIGWSLLARGMDAARRPAAQA
ncbi:MAG TPA: hypothetical protein VGE07_27590 [Herpetosiphonaceae bacterium]